MLNLLFIMYDGTVGNSEIEHAISQFDSSYRLNFSDFIKETKLNTHKCQFLCYQNKLNLVEAEECARNCFKPLLNAKKNISVLIEGKKEEFEKCKYQAESKSKENWYVQKEVEKCVKKYFEEMAGIKEEIEYIYKGYMKNFEFLLNEEKKI